MMITDKNICQLEPTVPLEADSIESDLLLCSLLKILSKLF